MWNEQAGGQWRDPRLCLPHVASILLRMVRVAETLHSLVDHGGSDRKLTEALGSRVGTHDGRGAQEIERTRSGGRESERKR
jgi:hypothetical protein